MTAKRIFLCHMALSGQLQKIIILEHLDRFLFSTVF